MSFTKRKVNPNLYYIFVGTNLFILMLYVDGLFLIGGNKLTVGCKVDMSVKFEMKDIEMTIYFLGLEV